jgi:hypothetical protein
LVFLETIVDPERFKGTGCRAANWAYLGETKGFAVPEPAIASVVGATYEFVSPILGRAPR